MKILVLISIHSLRMEGDVRRDHVMYDVWDFNPLPPHGGRLQAVQTCTPVGVFQSTPSAWRETLRKRRKLR